MPLIRKRLITREITTLFTLSFRKFLKKFWYVRSSSACASFFARDARSIIRCINRGPNQEGLSSTSNLKHVVPYIKDINIILEQFKNS